MIARSMKYFSSQFRGDLVVRRSSRYGGAGDVGTEIAALPV